MNIIWKKHVGHYYFVYVLGLVILCGCIGSGDTTPIPHSQQPTSVKATATIAPTATAVITPTSSPTPTSTLFSMAPASPTPTNPLQDNTPIPTPQSMTPESDRQEEEHALDACADTTLLFNNNKRGKVRWRFDDIGDLHCCEHMISIYQIDRSPDPKSNLALVTVITDGNVPGYSAKILVDFTTGVFKILGFDYIGEPRNKLAWLQNGQVAWIDDNGELYVGSLETQEPLNAPAKMTDLWFAKSERILVRDESLLFWHFDLKNSVWTQLPKSESDKITVGWIDYAAASEDGEYLFLFLHDYIAILSNDLGTVNIIDRKGHYSFASSGSLEYPLWSPPEQIKGTPYWFLNTIWLVREYSEMNYPTFRFVIDSRTGEIAEHDVLGIPPELAIYDSYLSPDRMWLAVEVVEDIQTLKSHSAEVSHTWFISLSTNEARVEDGEYDEWDVANQAYLNLPLSCTEREIAIDLTPPIKD